MTRIAALAALVLALGGAVAAAPMGPVRPQMLRTGSDIPGPIFDLGVLVDASRRDLDQGEIRVNRYLLTGATSFTDRTIIGVRLGLAEAKASELLVPGFTGFQQMDARTKFDAGVSLGVLLVRGEYFDVALNGNYHQAWGLNAGLSPAGGTQIAELDYGEVNAGLQVQANYFHFTPYVGVRFSEAFADWSRAFTRENNSDRTIGAYIGASFDLREDISGHLELRALDEVGGGGSIAVRF